MPQTHQHAQTAGREGVAPAAGFYGTRLGGAHGVNDSGTVQQVTTGSVFRDYTPPKRRQRDNPDRELCGVPECSAFPSKKHYPWCAGHARSKGLIK